MTWMHSARTQQAIAGAVAGLVTAIEAALRDVYGMDALLAELRAP